MISIIISNEWHYYYLSKSAEFNSFRYFVLITNFYSIDLQLNSYFIKLRLKVTTRTIQSNEFYLFILHFQKRTRKIKCSRYMKKYFHPLCCIIHWNSWYFMTLRAFCVFIRSHRVAQKHYSSLLWFGIEIRLNEWGRERKRRHDLIHFPWTLRKENMRRTNN